MKTNRLHFAWLFASLLLTVQVAPAATSVKAEINAIRDRARAKFAAGERTEAAYAREIAALDALRAKHAGEQSDEVAGILAGKAMLYLQMIQDEVKGTALIQQLKDEYPDSTFAAQADQVVATIQRQRAVGKIQLALAVGTKFPEFAESDLSGRAVSLADFKGKVVLLDFWATWCKPCVAELPHVLDAYRQHHARGFEIIGISLDRATERKKLAGFVKDNDLPWVQIYDGGFWESKLAVQFGVTSIPATYLLDGDGIIVAKNLRGPALEREVARLLAGK